MEQQSASEHGTELYNIGEDRAEHRGNKRQRFMFNTNAERRKLSWSPSLNSYLSFILVVLNSYHFTTI